MVLGAGREFGERIPGFFVPRFAVRGANHNIFHLFRRRFQSDFRLNLSEQDVTEQEMAVGRVGMCFKIPANHVSSFTDLSLVQKRSGRGQWRIPLIGVGGSNLRRTTGYRWRIWSANRVLLAATGDQKEEMKKKDSEDRREPRLVNHNNPFPLCFSQVLILFLLVFFGKRGTSWRGDLSIGRACRRYLEM